MLTLEYIAEQKTKYNDIVNYYQNLGFEHLATEFKNVINILKEVEEHIATQAEKPSDDNCK